MKIYALIPARAGSKGIKNKNITGFKGRPLLVHSIEHSLQAESIQRTFVSTDSEQYRAIAQAAGAEVPFLRPAAIAQDHSTDYEVFFHFINYLKTVEDSLPDIIVQLRPTYPIRKMGLVDKVITHFIAHYEEADSLRTVIPSPYSPWKMWSREGDYLKPLLLCGDLPESYNIPRQLLPQAYWQNACIDLIKSSTLLEKKSMSGDRILCYEMDQEESFDIDDYTDLQRLQKECKHV